MGSKRCVRCLEIKEAAEFYARPDTSDGYRTDCKRCYKTIVAGHRASLGRAECYHREKRSKARAAGVAYSLTREWFEREFRRGTCAASGVTLVLDAGPHHPFAPQVDRRQPGGPYSPENCHLVCRAYNMGKGPFSEDILQQVWGPWVRSREEEW